MPAIETARRVIDPRDCDILGHMNVNNYFVLCSDGGFSIQAACGLDRAALASDTPRSFAVVHADSTFAREVLAGDIIYQTSGVLEIGSKSASFLHRQYRSSDDKLVFSSTFKCLLMDLTKRRAMEIPDDLRARLLEFTTTPD